MVNPLITGDANPISIAIYSNGVVFDQADPFVMSFDPETFSSNLFYNIFKFVI